MKGGIQEDFTYKPKTLCLGLVCVYWASQQKFENLYIYVYIDQLLGKFSKLKNSLNIVEIIFNFKWSTPYQFFFINCRWLGWLTRQNVRLVSYHKLHNSWFVVPTTATKCSINLVYTEKSHFQQLLSNSKASTKCKQCVYHHILGLSCMFWFFSLT